MVDSKKPPETPKDRAIRNINDILRRNDEQYSNWLLRYALSLERTMDREKNRALALAFLFSGNFFYQVSDNLFMLLWQIPVGF